jgi:hypothetical protein
MNNENTLAHAAFVKAQKCFGSALKTSVNPHFKNRYADLASCVEAVIAGLNSNGLALMQVTHPSENGVAIETVLLHEGGGKISGGILHVPASKQDSQGYGSALTYCRRYSLLSTCGIAPENEDDDGNAASRRAAQPHRDAVAMIQAATTLQQLQAVWQGLSANERVSAKADKDKRKAVLMHLPLLPVEPAPAAPAPVERERTVDPKTGEYTW